MSSSNCCFLTCIQISQEAGQMVWYSHLLKNFPQFIVIHTVKGFGIVNKAEIDVFLELSCFFSDPVDVGNLISAFSAFLKSSLNSWKFMVHILLKPGLENSEHYFTSVWDECNCAVVWAFFGIAFLWDWNENSPFPVLWPLLSFPKFAGILSAALSQHHPSGWTGWISLQSKGLSRIFSNTTVQASVLLRSPRARHPGMWSQVGLRKHHYEQG